MAFLLFKENYFNSGSATHPGLVRRDNQDALLCLNDNGIFAVSDGMGGGEGGERAARIVIEQLRKAAARPSKTISSVTRYIYQANTEILRYAAVNNLKGMGATVAGMILDPFVPQNAMVFSAGDSRCYRLRGGELKLLTTDHTIASALGVPEEKLAKHLQGVLTNVTGGGTNFFVDTHPIELEAGDIYLICSDGVSRQLPDKILKQFLAMGLNGTERAFALVDGSLKKGGIDNATAIVLEFGRLPEVSAEILAEQQSCPDEPEEWEDDDVTPPTQ